MRQQDKDLKVCGIVAEFNPLHRGHQYLIRRARELTAADVVVAVMSGNFVQRGDFACLDKWRRAKAAVDAGVDLVLELPFPFVVQAATQFGRQAVDILARSGIDCLVFGSETNNLEELKEIAAMNFNIDHFRQNMKKGYSYPASYGYLADSYGPNDILAISYLRALQDHPQITPFSVKRLGDYLDDSLDVPCPSALAIRQALAEGKDVSAYTPLAADLRDFPAPNWQQMYPFVRMLLLTTPEKELHQSFLMEEGIENYLVRIARQSEDWDSFTAAAVTRRYTRSRIRRTLCHLLVHTRKQDMAALPEYDHLRPLAFNDTGQAYLRRLQDDGVVIANHYAENIKPYREMEYRAATVYGMLMDPGHRRLVVEAEICGPYLK